MGRLTLEGNEKPFSPGDTLRGRVDGLPAGAKLEVVFGPRERLSTDIEEKLPFLAREPQDEGEETLTSLVQEADSPAFSFKVPEGPFSFDGGRTALEWVVQARSGSWEARETVKVAPGAFSGKPKLAGDPAEELDSELHWAHPLLHYIGAGLLAAVGLVAAVVLGYSAAYPFAAAALWAAIAWGRHRWASSSGTGKITLNKRVLRPGDRLSVMGFVVSPKPLEDARLALTLRCEASFHRARDGDSGKSDEAEEKVFEKRIERPLGDLAAGAPAAFDGSWEAPSGPFTYAWGDDLTVEWFVNVQLSSRGRLVNEWDESVDVWP